MQEVCARDAASRDLRCGSYAGVLLQPLPKLLCSRFAVPGSHLPVQWWVKSQVHHRWLPGAQERCAAPRLPGGCSFLMHYAGTHVG